MTFTGNQLTEKLDNLSEVPLLLASSFEQLQFKEEEEDEKRYFLNNISKDSAYGSYGAMSSDIIEDPNATDELNACSFENLKAYDVVANCDIPSNQYENCKNEDFTNHECDGMLNAECCQQQQQQHFPCVATQFDNNTYDYSGSELVPSYDDFQMIDEQQDLSTYRIQNDPNPTVIRKPFNQPLPKYIQRVNVKYLRPPAPPSPGPLIVKEVRPPTPPPPPPLCIRQRHVPPKTPPPLILREMPPQKPPIIPAKVICKRLPTPPPPERQVIIERCPPLPPKPQDIIIERWLPYAPLPKRKVIYQKANRAPTYKTPKNIVIMYEAIPKLQRQFKKIGVVPMNPDAYKSKFGPTLLDGHSLVNNARRKGVYEDIDPPRLQNHHWENDNPIDTNGSHTFLHEFNNDEPEHYSNNYNEQVYTDEQMSHYLQSSLSIDNEQMDEHLQLDHQSAEENQNFGGYLF